MTEFSENLKYALALTGRKLELLDEFPPDQQAVDIKLQALALEVEAMDAIYRASINQHDVALSSFKHFYVQGMSNAQKNFDERLTEFLRVFNLIRDFCPKVHLLSDWQYYAKRYHEQAESKKLPISLPSIWISDPARKE